MIKLRLFAPICLRVIVMVLVLTDIKSCIQAWPTTGGVVEDIRVKVEVPLHQGSGPLQGKGTMLQDKSENNDNSQGKANAKLLEKKQPGGGKQMTSDRHKLDLDLEALKQHWLRLLGLGQEPGFTGGPQQVPAFMRAVYALYDSQAARDLLYQYLAQDTIAEQERTVRAILPQHGECLHQNTPKVEDGT